MSDVLLTFCRGLVHSDGDIQGALWAFRSPLGDLVKAHPDGTASSLSPTVPTSDRTLRTVCLAQITCERRAHESRMGDASYRRWSHVKTMP